MACFYDFWTFFVILMTKNALKMTCLQQVLSKITPTLSPKIHGEPPTLCPPPKVAVPP
jgi:hypothetical protein